MTRRVAAAVSTSLGPLVTGPGVRGEVIAAFPGAAYIAVDADIGVVALVATQAVPLPNAAIVEDDGGRLRELTAGAPARVGDGAVSVGGLTAVPSRWWDPVPRLPPVTPERLEAGRGAVARWVPRWPSADAVAAARLRSGHAELERGLVSPHGAWPTAAGAAATPAAPIERLVGLGAGLTPAGDDLLGGLMAALRLLGEALGCRQALAASDQLATSVTSRLATTTAVSAALLRQAARGAVAAPVAQVVRALVGQADAGTAARALLATGHSSGHDLAAGLLLGARAAVRLQQPALRPPVG